MFTIDQITSVKKLEYKSELYAYKVIANSKIYDVQLAEDNTEYQILKKWLEGNTAEAAD